MNNFAINSSEGEEGVLRGAHSPDIRPKARVDSFTVDIPANTPTGTYYASLMMDGTLTQAPIVIVGLSNPEKQAAIHVKPVIAPTVAATGTPIIYRTRICSNCSWEMVFAGDPNDPNKLVQSAANQFLMRSTTAGRTWKQDVMNDVASYAPNTYYLGDSKIVALKEGAMYLSSLFFQSSSELPFIVGGMFHKGGYLGALTRSLFQGILPGLPSWLWIVADYPKMAVSPDTGAVYISGNAVWFEDEQQYGYGLYESQDGGASFERHKLNIGGGAVTSMTYGRDNTLYAVHPSYHNDSNGREIIRFRSFQPLAFDTFVLPDFPGYSLSYTAARISPTSNRAWAVYRGPEVVADAGLSSPNRGRLYALWSQEERDISDPSFEYTTYGYNFDVFSSYSDDRGETWSQPVRVSDDVSKGDQFFPSAQVDSTGVLHIAFVDHRNNQDQATFDVYYTTSRDGMTFTKNIRVTDIPTANSIYGGRSIGDYLDMVVAYPDRAYVGYPCGQSEFGPTGACMVEIRASHPTSASTGFFDAISAQGIARGWALDKDTPAQSINVAIYMDGPKGQGTLIDTVPTNTVRPDVNCVISGGKWAAGVCTGGDGSIIGKHGFLWTIPAQYKTASHSWYIYGVDSADSSSMKLIVNSPKVFPTDTTPPTVSITALDASASEATKDRTGIYQITRTGTTTKQLAVAVSVSGTATRDIDYTLLRSGLGVGNKVTAVIPAGATSTTILLITKQDTEYEGTEAAIITLVKNKSYDVGLPESAKILINDDDPAPGSPTP